MKKIFIWSASWAEHTVSSYQSTVMYDFFVQNNYNLVTDAKDADVILLNGYPFDNYEEKIALVTINYYVKKYNNKEIILFWSIPEMVPWLRNFWNLNCIWLKDSFIFNDIFPHKIALEDVKIWKLRFFKPLKTEGLCLEEYWYLDDIESSYKYTDKEFQITVEDLEKWTYNDISHLEEYEGKYSYLEDKNDKYYIETTRWCWFNCSYCVIKNISWFTKSFPLDGIIDRIKKWLSMWAKSFVIIDEDCWSYWVDIWLNVSDLLNKINNIDADFTIKFYYFEPRNLEKYYHLIDKSFFEKRLEYIRVPLQTTSQRILKLMNRSYDIEHVVDILKEIKSINKKVIVESILMYWYPTETFEEFKDYFRLLKYFDCIDFLCYTAKKWTKSYNMPKVSSGEMLKRAKAILSISQRYPGKIEPILESMEKRKQMLDLIY